MKNIVYILMISIVFFTCKEKVDSTEISTSIDEIVDPLPSWNAGATKQAIMDFVAKTTTEGSEGFIPVEDRIATFDNDGNLWSEQPMYFQLFYAIDEIKRMAPEHPEWKTTQPFKAILDGDINTALAGGERAILELVMSTHGGMTTEEFDQNVKNWLATAKHPKTGLHYNEMIYQPMLELLNYLREHDYKTFIVSGGGIDFMRAWVEEAYGIPSYQVVGSSGKVKYEVGEDGIPKLVKLPELNFIDDKEGKPIGIHQNIGKRPVFASGNSDGDYQMLQWTTTATGYPRFGLLLHHTDGDREWSYDRTSHIGQLNKGLDDASKNGWTIIDMKNDWKVIYPSELKN